MAETKTDDARRAELAILAKTKKGMDQLRAMANGRDRDAMLARSVIRDIGGQEGAASMPQGDQEPTRKMKRGGMTKKFNKGGMAKCGASNPATQKSTKAIKTN